MDLKRGYQRGVFCNPREGSLLTDTIDLIWSRERQKALIGSIFKYAMAFVSAPDELKAATPAETT